MSKPLLHILFGPSGAGTLRETLVRLGRSDRVICPHDDFCFGPLATGDAERIAWIEEELGVTGWKSVVAITAPFLEASRSRGILPIAWISRRDARTYAGFLWWLLHLDGAPCRIIDVTELSIADDAGDPTSERLAISPSSLQPEQLARLLGTETDLAPAVRQGFEARARCLSSENAPPRVIDRRGQLVSAPISHFDPLLVSLATPAWKKVARIVGEALRSFADSGLHQSSDLFLASRAATLAEHGQFEWRGDLASMKDCELRLPRSTVA